MNTPIYFDYAATTPVDPRVALVMLQYLTADGIFGNPSSAHVFGKAAKDAVERARIQVADLIHAEPGEIIWTSGATESDNLALRGVAQLYQQKGKHIVTMRTEHAAVLDCCQQLEKEGYQVTYLSPQKNGLLDLDEFRDVLRDDTILVSIMHVNNETGVIQDIEAIGKITSQRGIFLHVDAAQSSGKAAINVNSMYADLMSLSAHKVYGPKGIGALYVRKKPRVRVAPQIFGGGHENGMRSGTLATHQIVGMGEACALAKNEMLSDAERLHELRKILLDGLLCFNDVSINTDPAISVPGILNIRFTGVKADVLMSALPEIAISAGSACSSKGIEPSYVLRALDLSHAEAQSSVRVSFGRFTTREEVEFLLRAFAKFLAAKTLS